MINFASFRGALIITIAMIGCGCLIQATAFAQQGAVPPPPPPQEGETGSMSGVTSSIYLDAGITAAAIGLGLFAVYRNLPKN